MATDAAPNGDAAGVVSGPADDFDTCKARSSAKVRELRAAGRDARWVQLAGQVTAPPDADPRWVAVPPEHRHHYVAVVDGIVIDSAPRQFWPDAPAELVADAGAYLAGWAASYDVTDALGIS